MTLAAPLALESAQVSCSVIKAPVNRYNHKLAKYYVNNYVHFFSMVLYSVTHDLVYIFQIDAVEPLC